MKNTVGKPQPIYSDSFKLGVVMRVANGQLTKEQARIAYHIGGKSAILEWMRKFGYSSEPVDNKAMAIPNDKLDPEHLKKKVNQLEKQRQNERIHSEFYQTMIIVAERELGISIKKAPTHRRGLLPFSNKKIENSFRLFLQKANCKSANFGQMNIQCR